MIHTLYRRATHTFHTPSWVTSYLCWFFLSSSSLQFVFSEPLRFEHQLRSQLLCSKLVSRSINRQQTPVSKYHTSFSSIDQGSTKQDDKQNWSRSLRRHGLRSLTVMTPGSCTFHHWDLESQLLSSEHLTGQNDKRLS